MRTPGRSPGPWLAVAGLSASFAAAFAFLAVRRHDGFFTARYDLGNMTQAVWSVAHGQLLRVTDGDGTQMSRLGGHIDPILALFAPLWRLWPDPRMLLVVQAVAIASAAIPAFLLARRWLADDRLAVTFAAVTLLYPALQWATLFDFHPVTLAAPLILWCVWAADTRHDVVLAICAVLALMTKEQVGLALAILGVWMAVSLGRRRAGTILAAGSVAWTVLAIWVLIPAFNAGSGSALVEERYGALGSDAGDVLKALVTRPWDAAEIMATGDRALYVAALVLPLLALCLWAPLLSAGALPDLVLNLLSSGESQHRIEYHYAAVIAPFLIAGSIRGLATIRARRTPSALARAAGSAPLVSALLLGAVVVGGWLLGPLPFWRHVPGGSQVRAEQFTVDARAAVLADAVERIPPTAVVSAGNRLGARLSARRRILTFPVIEDARYVIVDERRPDVGDELDAVAHARSLAALRRDPRFTLAYERDGVLIFTRGAGT